MRHQLGLAWEPVGSHGMNYRRECQMCGQVFPVTSPIEQVDGECDGLEDDMEKVGIVTGNPHSEDIPVLINGPGPDFRDTRCGLQPRSRPSRDETWLRVAETIAQRGTCPRRQVGCVIVDNHGRIMATGYNGPASGRPHCSEGEPCPGAAYTSGEGLDKCEAIHAEQNACLLLNNPWEVDTVYITVSPCLSCVKLLLGTSAKRIICREKYTHADAIEWWRRSGRQLVYLPLFNWTYFTPSRGGQQ